MNDVNKKRWNMLVCKIEEPVRKKQFANFVEFLKEKTAYFTAPAAPHQHCSWEGGLLEHSLNVAENAIKLNEALDAGLNEEELIIAGLFHDLGKCYIGDNTPYYLINQPTDRQQQYGYVAFPQYSYNDAPQVFLTVPQRAVRLVTQYIDISDACYQAILIHDGQYVDENHPYATRENPMASILQYADNWAGFHMEGYSYKSKDGKSVLTAKRDKLGENGLLTRKSMVER